MNDSDGQEPGVREALDQGALLGMAIPQNPQPLEADLIAASLRSQVPEVRQQRDGSVVLHWLPGLDQDLDLLPVFLDPGCQPVKMLRATPRLKGSTARQAR